MHHVATTLVVVFEVQLVFDTPASYFRAAHFSDDDGSVAYRVVLFTFN